MSNRETSEQNPNLSWASFGHGLPTERIDRPYEAFAKLRQRGSVHIGSLWELLGLTEWNILRLASSRAKAVFTVVGYDAVHQVLTQHQIFSSASYRKSGFAIVMGNSILTMDEPQHRHWRLPVETHFARRTIERWERTLMRPLAEAFINRVADFGRADLVRDFTLPFPIEVISSILGVRKSDLAQFIRWAIDLINVESDWARGIEAARELNQFLLRQLEMAQRHRPKGLIGSILAGDLAGSEDYQHQMIGFLKLLLPAGAETMYRSLGNVLFALLTHPDQLCVVRDDPSLLGVAIEEALRWEAPVTHVTRWVKEDTVIDQVPIPAASLVGVCLGSANHDEQRFERPGEFNIFRKRRSNSAFGFGPHTCLGMHMARVELESALRCIFKRLPKIQLDPEAQAPRIEGLAFRAPDCLPVIW